MKVNEFDYFLPEDLIAQFPAEPRDASRLMVLHKDRGLIEHRFFRDIIEFLQPGDALVINDTKVIPARIFASKETGALIEVVLLKQIDAQCWEVLVRPGKKARIGSRLAFSPGELEATVVDDTPAGGRILKFEYSGDFFHILEKIGRMPLPPYIKEACNSGEKYQTVYARERGSVAAPTAGLHFTDQLLGEMKKKGVEIISVLLHVGLGTFRPVKTENVEDHLMHTEYYEISRQSAEKINQVRKNGGRVFSVGTTSTRTLETASEPNGTVIPGKGWTDKYIFPGYHFKVVDALITNFHLPKSTLLMLVSAFADREMILHAYEEAIRERYRFFSFGDAMLII